MNRRSDLFCSAVFCYYYSSSFFHSSNIFLTVSLFEGSVQKCINLFIHSSTVIPIGSSISLTWLYKSSSISNDIYLSKIEAGKSDFGVSVLIRLSEALQVSTDKLLRPVIPETTIIVSDELSNLLMDCTLTEKSSIVETAKNMKKAFYEAKKEKI